MKDLIKVKKGNAHMTIDVDAVVKDQKAFAEASVSPTGILSGSFFPRFSYSLFKDHNPSFPEP